MASRVSCRLATESTNRTSHVHPSSSKAYSFQARVSSQRDYTLHLGEISWSNLLGKWERSKQFGKLIPVSGMAYYLTTPPTWADATSDLINVCIYDVFLLMGCALVSAAWFRIRACAQRYQARLLGYPASLTPAQPETISFNQWTRHVIRIAFTVGFCVGALTLLAGFMGVIGSGTGIMLAVTMIYSNFKLDNIASRTGLFGL